MTKDDTTLLGHGIKGETALRSMNLLAGEVIGTSAEVAVLSHIDKVDRALPGPTDGIKHALKNFITKPLIGPIESTLKAIKGIEGQEDFDERMMQTKDVRAQRYADALYRYGAATGIGYFTMMATQGALNKAVGSPMRKEDAFKVLATDGLVHVGAITVMALPVISDTTQKVKGALSCVFKSFGVDDAKAKDMANYAVVVQVPNYAAFLADVGVLYALTKGASGKGSKLLPHG